MNPIIVTISVDTNETALKIAQLLIETKLAACVQISSEIKSVYRWKNDIEVDNEYICNAKTDKRLFKKIVSQVSKIHPYETPEIIATEITEIAPDYKKWLKQNLIT